METDGTLICQTDNKPAYWELVGTDGVVNADGTGPDAAAVEKIVVGATDSADINDVAVHISGDISDTNSEDYRGTAVTDGSTLSLGDGSTHQLSLTYDESTTVTSLDSFVEQSDGTYSNDIVFGEDITDSLAIGTSVSDA